MKKYSHANLNKNKMLVDTSLKAYFEIKNEGLISHRQSMVFDLIKKNPCLTDSEIMFRLGFSIPNMIRPRRNELYKKGLIKCSGKRRCSITNRTCKTWSVK